MSKTKITRKGQVTIPIEIRNKLLLKESDNLEVKIVDNYIVMEKFITFDNLKGSIKLPARYKGKNWKELESISQNEHAKEAFNE
jgi:AbrB family looped-hinge helix DNA binding protein